MSSDPPEQTPPEQTPDPDSPRRPSSRLYPTLLKVGAGVGTVAAVGGAVIAIWGNVILTERVLPRVKVAIDKAIERPVELGAVEGFSLWSVRLGKTVMPPT
ncbi:MAG: hypothetical protein WBD47_08485, partial [Phormidesmis sp.]